MMRSTTADIYDSAVQPHPAVRELRALVAYRELAWVLAARNLKVRYKRSLLGIGWSMLAPLMTMLALSVVFASLFRPSTPDYPVFLFPGLILWGFFSQSTTMIAAEIVGGAELWRRVYAPRSALAIAHAVTGLMHLGLAIVPLLGMMIVYGSRFSVALLTVPLTAIATALFALGIGLLVATWSRRFADVMELYQVLLGVWMYLTPVIYPPSIVPERFRWIQALNPMSLFVELFRQPFHAATAPDAGALLAAMAIGLVTCAVGWWVFTKAVYDARSFT